MTSTCTNNRERANAASVALQAYMQGKGLDTEPYLQTANETMTDLLTDLRHLSHAAGIDFAAAVRISEYHFEEESN